MPNADDWRPEYARRHNARGIRRPAPPPVYVRPTDEQIAALLPEPARTFAAFQRSLNDFAATPSGQLLLAMARR